MIIRASDRIGVIDLHFLRYLHLSLFTHRSLDVFADPANIEDVAMILFIITPLFVLGLRFWTAPVYINYRLRINSFLLPACIAPLFFAKHFDVILLGIVVFFMNWTAFYQHMDAPVNLYQIANRRVRGRRTKESVELQLDRRELIQFGRVRD